MSATKKLKVLAIAAVSAGVICSVPTLSLARAHYTGKRPASISLMPMFATGDATPVAVKKAHKASAHKKAKHTIHTKGHRTHKAKTKAK